MGLLLHTTSTKRW